MSSAFHSAQGLEPAAGRNPASSCPNQVISGVLHLSEPRFFIQETQMKPSTSLRASGILPALSKHTEPLPGTQGTSRNPAGSSGEGAGKQSANSVTPSAV